MTVQVKGSYLGYRYAVMDGQVLRQSTNEKISLPVERGIGTDDYLIEMALTIFKGHRAGTVSIQNHPVGITSNKTSVITKLAEIAFDS